MPNKIKSKAQAKFLGAVAGGAIKKQGLSKKKAKDMLQGANISQLPKRK